MTDPDLRADLRDAWLVLAQSGLIDSVFNHISLSEGDGSMWINRFGEIPAKATSESFVRIELGGRTPVGINPDGFAVHGEIHQIRSKPGAVVHLHSINALAVGMSEAGLLPLSQTSMEFVDDVSYFDYDGPLSMSSRLTELAYQVRSGGCCFLRHHGLLVVGDSVEIVTYMAYYVEEACRIQNAALPVWDHVLPSEDVIRVTSSAMKSDRPTLAVSWFEAMRDWIRRT